MTDLVASVISVSDGFEGIGSMEADECRVD